MKITASGLLFAIVGALLWLLIVVPFASAQDEHERRTIPVSVVDKDGNFVEDLTAENFRATISRRPVKVLSAEEDNEARRIIVLVDVSSSMDENTKRERAWWAAKDVVVKLAPKHDMVLVTFAEGLELHPGLETTDEKELTAAVLAAEERSRNRTPGRLSALFDMLIAAVKPLQEERFGDVVYVISDGEESASESPRRNTESFLASRGVRTFFVVVNDLYLLDRGRSHLSSVGRSRLSSVDIGRMAETTGGSMVILNSRSWASFTAHEFPLSFYDPIEKLYRMEIEFPRKLGKERKWKLEVVDERGKKMKGVKVLYPRLLVPLEAPPEK